MTFSPQNLPAGRTVTYRPRLSTAGRAHAAARARLAAGPRGGDPGRGHQRRQLGRRRHPADKCDGLSGNRAHASAAPAGRNPGQWCAVSRWFRCCCSRSWAAGPPPRPLSRPIRTIPARATAATPAAPTARARIANYRYGVRWFGDYRRVVEDVSGGTFCIDLRFWYPSKSFGYEARSAAGLQNKENEAVSALKLRRMNRALWRYGRSNNAAQQAAVMVYVHRLMADGAPGEADPNALSAGEPADLRAGRARRRALRRARTRCARRCRRGSTSARRAS